MSKISRFMSLVPCPKTLCLLFLAAIMFPSCTDVPNELLDEADSKTYLYCVLRNQQMCLAAGGFTASNCSGEPSDNCPSDYVFSNKGCYYGDQWSDDGETRYSGNVIYNHETSFCYDGEVYPKCDGMEYNPTTHLCNGYAAIPARCGDVTSYGSGRAYNPSKERCQDGVVEAQCYSRGWYSVHDQFCSSGYHGYDIFNKCLNIVEYGYPIDYNPQFQICYDSFIETKCGAENRGTWFESQWWENSGWYVEWDANSRCNNDVFETKCGASWHNPATHYCKNGTTPTQYSGSVTHQGQKYKTIVIGTQTWMAENLNYGGSGKCNDGGSRNNDYYSDTEAEAIERRNCDTYGRFYDWNAAIGVTELCPSGWHIPSSEEWQTLIDYVESENSCTDCAGKYLKATSGWDRALNGAVYYENNNGLDTYGFSALMSGSNGNLSYGSFWWSSTEAEDELYNNNYATNCIIYSNEVSCGYDTKDNIKSIRCVKD